MTSPPPSRSPLSDDVIRGAGRIAEMLYGHAKHRRRVYYLTETRQLPHFKLGATICARRSTILGWIHEQETASVLTEDA